MSVLHCLRVGARHLVMWVVMKVLVDQGSCVVASGRRVPAAPSVIDQRDADGVVELVMPESEEEVAADVRGAAAICPALAISAWE